MIPLIPYRKFTIDTLLTQQEAIDKLSAEVAPQRGLIAWFDTRSQLFEGFLYQDKFQISRIIRCRNSFLPYLYGRFHVCPAGIQIQVVMTFHPLILVIVIGLSLSAGLLVAAIIYQLVTMGDADNFLKKFAIGFGFGYLVAIFSFGYEVKLATQLLTRVFEVKPPLKPSRPVV